jgi:hypothetical protein
MNTSNIKSTLSTIAGILGAIGVIIGSLGTQGIALPEWVYIVGGVCGTVSITLIGILQGRNPDGTVKTPIQVSDINTKAAETKPPETK